MQPIKVRHVTVEARSLDAVELKDISAPKRFTLLLTLISRAQIEAGRLVKQAVVRHGDVRQLLASCEAIAAYHGDNYPPLLWRFRRSHRSTLFRFTHTTLSRHRHSVMLRAPP